MHCPLSQLSRYLGYSCNHVTEPKGQKPSVIYVVVWLDGKQYKFSIGAKCYPKFRNKRKYVNEMKNKRLDYIVNNILLFPRNMLCLLLFSGLLYLLMHDRKKS